MPKLKESEDKKNDNLVRAYIAKNQALYSLDDDVVATKLHCTKRTFQNKKKRPATFTLGELRMLVAALKFSDEEKNVFL